MLPERILQGAPARGQSLANGMLTRVDNALRSRTTIILAAMIAACLLLQLHLVFDQPVNWDEFRFLADVHNHARGELTQIVQTLHVHLFGWVTAFDNEVDQIRAARLALLAVEAGTLMLVYAAAHRFVGVQPALFAVLAYISFSFVLRHGASFRFDPLATFLLMLAVVALLSRQLRWSTMVVAGMAVAAAAMVTVKAVFYVPLLLALGFWRLIEAESRRDVFLRLGGAAISSAAFLALFYTLHAASMASPDTAASGANIVQSYDKTVGQGQFLPRGVELLRSVLANPVHWLFILLGLLSLARSLLQGPQRVQALALVSLALPLSAILFYRNAFPYFYVFMLAPAAVVMAVGAARHEWRSRLAYPAAVMMAGAILHHQAGISPAIAKQRQVIEAAHSLFPEPVAYIDRCSMISSFPQVGLFLSSWGVESYRTAGQPVMRRLLLEHQPAFLILNSPVLADAFAAGNPRKVSGLFEADRFVLQQNFIPHWGPIFVAGKRLELTSSSSLLSFEILIEGPYTVESVRPVLIDGVPYEPGAVLLMVAGRHNAASVSGSQELVLRWGERLARPNQSAPDGPLFGGF